MYFMRRLQYALLFFTTSCLCEKILVKSTRSNITIIRDYKYGDDEIRLNSAKCISSANPCSSFRANQLQSGDCGCYCGKNQSTFYEQTRRCAKNEDIRQKEGCRFLFKDEDPSSPMTVLSRPLLWSLKEVAFNSSTEQCRINGAHGHSSYMTCGGKWKPLTAEQISNAFNVSSKWSSEYVFVQILSTGKTSTFIDGRLLKFTIECQPKQSPGEIRKSCILFKIKGQVKCPYKSESHVPTTMTSRSAFQATSVPTRRISHAPSKAHSPVIQIDEAENSSSTKHDTETSNVLVMVFVFLSCFLLGTVLVLVYLMTRHRNKRNGTIETNPTIQYDGNRTRGLEAEDAENVYEDVFSSELTACSNLGFKDSCLEINKGRKTGVKTSCTGYKSLDRKDEDLYQFLVYLQVSKSCYEEMGSLQHERDRPVRRSVEIRENYLHSKTRSLVSDEENAGECYVFPMDSYQDSREEAACKKTSSQDNDEQEKEQEHVYLELI